MSDEGLAAVAALGAVEHPKAIASTETASAANVTARALELIATEVAPATSSPTVSSPTTLVASAPALARALRAERKTVGMLRAIERLTNLGALPPTGAPNRDLVLSRPRSRSHTISLRKRLFT